MASTGNSDKNKKKDKDMNNSNNNKNDVDAEEDEADIKPAAKEITSKLTGVDDDSKPVVAETKKAAQKRNPHPQPRENFLANVRP